MTELEQFVNLQEAAKVLKITTRALHERIKAGYYEVMRVGVVLIDPETGKPLSQRELKEIKVRSRGRPAGKYGKYKKRKKKSSRS